MDDDLWVIFEDTQDAIIDQGDVRSGPENPKQRDQMAERMGACSSADRTCLLR